jgi:hypothetical protein
MSYYRIVSLIPDLSKLIVIQINISYADFRAYFI